MPRATQAKARHAEIGRLDATSRTRALTESESRRLEALLYRERYINHHAPRAACREHAA
ncbi:MULTISPECIES: hypothetical protein [unclassified Sphingomonas]|uniref:hypothetical protein n=1 Tax=unclassified Sphingomonas TaxID=196159 RepID=UPI00226A9C05|nr:MULTISPECIES: hypothetical protein [unclassified Sphingomonas]